MKKLRPDFRPSISDNRGVARGAHVQRIQYFSRARKHTYDMAVREWLPMLLNQFTPAHLARFSATSSLSEVKELSTEEYYNNAPTQLNAITTALNLVVLHDAIHHYEDAKGALELRNYEMCKTSARLVMHAFELLIYVAIVQGSLSICVWHGCTLHLTKMMLRLNDKLEFAHAQVVQAQEASDLGEPMTVNTFTNNATKNYATRLLT